MTIQEQVKAYDRFNREISVGDKVFYISGEYNSSNVYVEPVKVSDIKRNNAGQVKVQIDRGYIKSSVSSQKLVIVSTKGIKF